MMSAVVHVTDPVFRFGLVWPSLKICFTKNKNRYTGKTTQLGDWLLIIEILKNFDIVTPTRTAILSIYLKYF